MSHNTLQIDYLTSFLFFPIIIAPTIPTIPAAANATTQIPTDAVSPVCTALFELFVLPVFPLELPFPSGLPEPWFPESGFSGFGFSGFGFSGSGFSGSGFSGDGFYGSGFLASVTVIANSVSKPP